MGGPASMLPQVQSAPVQVQTMGGGGSAASVPTQVQSGSYAGQPQTIGGGVGGAVGAGVG